MTDGEIITSYKQAKNRKKQIGILAELNDTTPDTIKDILVKAGIALPAPLNRTARRPHKLPPK